MASVYLDTADSIWDDLLVLSLSEFGRTSKENGSVGTDHGEATVLFAAGGGVNGGIYNCDAGTWATGDLFSTAEDPPRYVSHLTDFRTVLADVVDLHFDQGLQLSDVIPGWSGLTGPEFDSLGFL